MQTLEIKLDITEDLIAQAGIDALKQYLNRAAESFKNQLLADKFRNAVGNDEQVDRDFYEAKQEAWSDCKKRHLPEHLAEIVNRREIR